MTLLKSCFERRNAPLCFFVPPVNMISPEESVADEEKHGAEL